MMGVIWKGGRDFIRDGPSDKQTYMYAAMMASVGHGEPTNGQSARRVSTKDGRAEISKEAE